MIYFIRVLETGLIKIGRSRQLRDRERKLRYELGPFEWLGVMDGGVSDEADILKRFDNDLAKGREHFYPSGDLLAFIKTHTSPVVFNRRKPAVKPVKPSPAYGPKQRPVRTHLRQLREQFGYSRHDLVEALDISYQSILKWENSPMTKISVNVLHKLLGHFECTFEELVYEVDERPHPAS